MNFVVYLAVCSALILSCSFAASSAAAFAGSDLHIHGVVRDSASRAPLHGASVRVVGTSIGAIADRYGAFDIHNVNLSTNLSTTPNTTPNNNRNISGDSLKLRVSYVGYAVTEIVVSDASDRHASNRATSSSGSAHREVRVEILMKPLQKMERAVEVIGTRIVNAALPAQQATVLDEAAIDEHRGQTFADALTQVPGVTLVQTGAGIKKPMINGMTGTRLVLRNNNVVQEGQQWGMEHAPEIDALSPVTITVVKGPAAVKFGPNAL
ncbi:MAG: TonB-dependent receptor plug domain-containing protein, partial [Candidatus Kapaibacterium sp.]